MIGLSNKSSIEVKNGIGIAISMVFSYFAGMMNSDKQTEPSIFN
ncbi:MAG: hypothetical protein E6706_05295 [Anaerococcus hydrogenalis]|nr:hypothetical protein [Anaerococcus hydrogenalis]